MKIFVRLMVVFLLLFVTAVQTKAQKCDPNDEECINTRMEIAREGLEKLRARKSRDYIKAFYDPEVAYDCILIDLEWAHGKKLSDIGTDQAELDRLLAQNLRWQAKAWWKELRAFRRKHLYRNKLLDPGNTYDLILIYLRRAVELSGQSFFDEAVLLTELDVTREELCRTMSRLHGMVERYLKEECDCARRVNLIAWHRKQRDQWHAGIVYVDPY